MAELSSDGSSPARRAADWLAGLMAPDGSLRGAGSINDYYKAVVGLAAAGRHNASERMFNYVVRRYLRDDGDLDGTGCAWFDQFRTYPHAWLLMAAVVRARFDLVRLWARFLERFQDPDNGGFYGTLEHQRRRGEQEMMTTGVAAIALLWAGRVEAALRAGHWLRRLHDAQPDLSRGLYFVWNRQTGLVTDFPEAKALEYRIDAGKTGQWYFQYGIAAALGSGLFGVTGDRAWLDLGRKYLDATKHCREDVFRQGTSGKIGWGAAWMYRMTHDPADRAVAEAVHANLRAAQHPDGWWSVENIYSRDWSSCPTPQIDVTGEFAALLSWIETALVPEASSSKTVSPAPD
jgi:hypothetical protein